MKNFYIALFLLSSPISYSQSPCFGLDSLNYGSQWYHKVQIGSQCWLKENLNIGTMVPAIMDQPNDSIVQKFCYNNDPAMCNVYGGLYQWKEAMRYITYSGARGICPLGWHIPSNLEFDTLTSTVNDNGNSLKKVGQGQGTNTSGFSLLLSGINEYNSFYSLGNETDLWSSTKVYIEGPGKSYVLFAHNRGIYSDSIIFQNEIIYDGLHGLSVRCIKDNVGLLLQSPFGGESWQVGSTHKISWSGTNASQTYIIIEYTIDNGSNWISLSNSVPGKQADYFWTIPNTPSKQCKVRIADLSNPQFYSISDSSFTIYNYCPGGPTVVHQGKVYNTVMMGNECWFKENLNIGTMIPGVQQAAYNGIIEKYCYNDDTNNCNIYGGLYTSTEMLEAGICPTFWHIGKIWSVIDYVNDDVNSLKAKGQGSGFGEGTDFSGFSALLAGRRNMNDGTFSDLGVTAWFPLNQYLSFVYADYFWYSYSYLYDTEQFGDAGGSVRCVRDDVGPLLLTSPVGGENWLIGSTQKISWALSNVINIKIDYTTDNGTSWINIIPSLSASLGSYIWIIPNTPSKNSRVKISSVMNPDTNNISNLFWIYNNDSNPCPGIPIVNYGGQNYNTVAIGDQCWLKENINIGTMIDSIQVQTNNGIIEKFCYYHDTTYCRIYGGLYQWDEAMQYNTTQGAQGICPSGWHIPSWDEFSVLIAWVGNDGDNLKAIGQGTGRNTSGFSALLAGGRSNDGNSVNLGFGTEIIGSDYSLSLQADNFIFSSYNSNELGLSVRCINDLKISELPVELINFEAIITENMVRLKWITATEVNSSSFEVEKKTLNNNYWQKIASLKASGNSTTSRQYSYTDKNINAGKYDYRLKMVDLDGSSKYSNIINVEIAPPAKFELSNAYPNPWNPTTTIRYQVPVNILVTIKIFDALGREVSTLVNEEKPAGSYEVTLNSKNLSSGVYYYQMKAANFIETKKFILMK